MKMYNIPPIPLLHIYGETIEVEKKECDSKDAFEILNPSLRGVNVLEAPLYIRTVVATTN